MVNVYGKPGKHGRLEDLGPAEPGWHTLKKILERKDQYFYVARRTFTNLFLGVTYFHRAGSNLRN